MPCSICGNRGHNMKTCDRAEFLKYIDPNVFHIRICDKDNVKEDMEVKPVEDGCETEVDRDRNSKINIYGDEYKACMDQSIEFEKSDVGDYYRSKFCLNCTKSICQVNSINTAYDNIKEKISNSNKDILDVNRPKLCILPLGHSGDCKHTFEIFKKNSKTKKLKTSIEQAIYSTPGDDDYVYKNRASRLFPIVLTSKQEKQIRNKNIKLKSAIPMREMSTPFLLATAYIDWITFILNVNDIDSLINKNLKLYEHVKIYNDHKTYLQKYYKNYKRDVFIDGCTICPITKRKIELIDIVDINRDNRFDISDYDIQLGHLESRCDECITIRGCNLLMMSRKGNRLIGENNFKDNAWILELIKIANLHKQSI